MAQASLGNDSTIDFGLVERRRRRRSCAST